MLRAGPLWEGWRERDCLIWDCLGGFLEEEVVKRSHGLQGLENCEFRGQALQTSRKIEHKNHPEGVTSAEMAE